MSVPSTNNDRFNAEAAAWDSNPDVHKASSLALQSILEHSPHIKPNGKELDVLEIGCGTGVLSLMIAPFIRTLTAVDSAHGMVDALNIKLSKQPEIENILPVCALLEDPDDVRIRLDPLDRGRHQNLPPRRFDLVVSHLVMHHIHSLPDTFNTIHGCLKSGGRIALTDYEDFGPEARRFHPEAKMQGVERHGIHREDVEKMLQEAGFVDVQVQAAFEMEKFVEETPWAGVTRGEGGVKMRFPFLVCLGRREQ